MENCLICNCIPCNCYVNNCPPYWAIRLAWECPRCHRINAPHIDYCSCCPINIYNPPQTTIGGTACMDVSGIITVEN